MSTVVQRLSSVQPHLLSELRPLERKLGLVFTLFKGKFPLFSVFSPFSSHARRLTLFLITASVWSILRQREDQQMYEEETRQ